MKNRNCILTRIVSSLLAVILTGTAVFCTSSRISGHGIYELLPVIAAGSAFHIVPGSVHSTSPASSIQDNHTTEIPSNIKNEEKTDKRKTDDKSPAVKRKNNEVKSADREFKSSEPTESEIRKYDLEHKDEEKYPVVEFTTTQGNISYDGIQVKNNSSYDLDIKEELGGKLGFTIERSEQPQVLIYHTHTSESFLRYDTGYYYESFYPRSSDKTQNVCAVGQELCDELNSLGIVTLHDTTIHDDPSYSGAYDRSYDTVMSYLKRYPSIKVVLDIHRDGLGTDTQRSKPVFYANGRKGAQMMILAGYNYDDQEDFKHWEQNLRFALKLQKKASDYYPDMVRPLYFNDFMYNMNINSGSLLIEIGADSNTVDEVRYTAFLLAKLLAEVFEDERKAEEINGT